MSMLIPEFIRCMDPNWLVVAEDKRRRLVDNERKARGERARASPTKTLFNFAVEVQASTLNHVISPGIYHFTLQVAAANAKPEIFKFEICLYGDWFENEDDMLNKGLRINPL